MLGRFKRKLSRTQSVPNDAESADVESLWQTRTETSLTPSDEQLVSRLAFTPETEMIERAPVHRSASVNTKWSERTIFNDVETGFLSLPTEILSHLQRYLAPSSEVALRHSCSRFLLLYKLHSFYLLGEELFQFICMTERDQDPTQMDRLVCGHCKQLHPKSAFPSSEVRQEPLNRDCRQVWLCPHKSMGYQRTSKTIKAGVEAPFRAENILPCSRCRETIRSRSIADRPERGTSQMELESEKAESLLISKIGLMQAPAPMYNVRGSSGSSGMYREVFGVKEVSSALQSVDFQVCPHLNLGDPYILSKFCRSCTNTQRLPPGVRAPPCIAETDKKGFGAAKQFGRCKGSCYTKSCKTKFMFQARESLTPDGSGRRQVWLIMVIYRWLGPLQSVGSDRIWRDHASTYKTRIQMKKKWTEWDRTHPGQQCMPNWSICLLHPEDCNLRRDLGLEGSQHLANALSLMKTTSK